jgi:ketosteroid isomerase-like protein
MLLSFALASVSFVSTVSAENAGKVEADPKITVTTTVTSIDDDGLATIQVDIDSDVFEAATKSGLNYANVNGIMGWQYAIQLNDEFFAAEDPDYMAIVEDVGMIAKGVDINSNVPKYNLVKFSAATTALNKFHVGGTVIAFMVPVVDGVDDVEKVNQNIGTYGDVTMSLIRYTAGNVTENTTVGNTAVDNYATIMVMGTPSTVIETKDPTVTGVTVTPATATVAGGATQAFAAVVAGEEGVDSEGGAVAVPQDVVWSATAGSITEDGVFTAPAATDEAQTVTVTATAKGTDVAASATVTVPKKVYDVVAPVVTGVTVAPAAATVAGGETQTFTATVSGTNGNDADNKAVAYSTDVTWTATAGSITDAGVFTAPAATEEDQTITVTATSAADASVSGTATVTVPGVKAPEVEKVTVTDAKKTLAEEFANTMYWGVKIAGGAEGVDLLLSDGQDTKAINNLGFEGIELNGDVTFGVYVTLSSARLDRAISLKVTETGTGKSATSTAVAYSELN